MPVIYEDTLNKAGKHDVKRAWWEAHGVEVVRARLDGRHGVPVDFGDYWAEGSNVVVDTKRSIDEVAQNINGKPHDRFKRECQRAQAAGYRLVVLVENRDGVADVHGLYRWTNGHCVPCRHRIEGKCRPRDASAKCPRHGTRKPIQGPRLAKAMETMEERYGVRFEFCKPQESARRVCGLLGIGWEVESDG